ncbi:hypothetical protein HC928_23625 [bacterium]|nr:hypothetical protein [bacterium]
MLGGLILVGGLIAGAAFLLGGKMIGSPLVTRAELYDSLPTRMKTKLMRG